MSNAEPEPHHDHIAVEPTARSFGKKLIEWFWRGTSIRAQQLALPEFGARSAVFAERARGTAAIALSTLQPAEPPEIAVEGIACELYRQSAYWSLLALGGDENSPWDSLEEALLTRIAPDGARRVTLASTLREGTFTYFAALSSEEQVATCLELRKLAEVLLQKLDQRNRAIDSLYLQRVWRLGLLALALGGLIGAAFWLRSVVEARRDMAAHVVWKASSWFDNGGCVAPAQSCSTSPNFFFHTAEERNPWLSFDLGSVKTVSTVLIDNREECCTDRAVPLDVELSEDDKTWHTLATKIEPFNSWRASFAPTKARWVRLRVKKKTWFHLARVRILP